MATLLFINNNIFLVSYLCALASWDSWLMALLIMVVVLFVCLFVFNLSVRYIFILVHLSKLRKLSDLKSLELGS